MLDLVEEPFDQIARAIQIRAEADRIFVARLISLAARSVSEKFIGMMSNARILFLRLESGGIFIARNHYCDFIRCIAFKVLMSGKICCGKNLNFVTEVRDCFGFKYPLK